MQQAQNYLLAHPFDEDLPQNYKLRIIQNHDGVSLRLAHFLPNVRLNKAYSIIIFQGYDESIETYYDTINVLQNLGFHVICFDWQGQGLSEALLQDAKKGYIKTYDKYMLDAIAVFDYIKTLSIPQEYLIMANSMGGHLAIKFLQNYRYFNIKKLILIAPMMELRYPNWLLKMVTKVINKLGFAESYLSNIGIKDNKLLVTKQAIAYKKALIKQDDKLQKLGVTWAWLRASTSSMYKVNNTENKSISLPTIIFMAKKDKLVNNNTTKKVAKQILTNAKLIELDCHHEILMAEKKVAEIFWQEFKRFV